MGSLTYAHQTLDADLDLNTVEMPADLREHYREQIREGKKTLAALDQIEAYTAKLREIKEKSEAELKELEETLPQTILSFAKEEVEHGQVIQHRTKIAEVKTLISDIDQATFMIGETVCQRPIREATRAIDKVRFRRDEQDKKAEKDKKEGKR